MCISAKRKSENLLGGTPQQKVIIKLKELFVALVSGALILWVIIGAVSSLAGSILAPDSNNVGALAFAVIMLLEKSKGWSWHPAHSLNTKKNGTHHCFTAVPVAGKRQPNNGGQKQAPAKRVTTEKNVQCLVNHTTWKSLLEQCPTAHTTIHNIGNVQLGNDMQKKQCQQVFHCIPCHHLCNTNEASMHHLYRTNASPVKYALAVSQSMTPFVVVGEPFPKYCSPLPRVSPRAPTTSCVAFNLIWNKIPHISTRYNDNDSICDETNGRTVELCHVEANTHYIISVTCKHAPQPKKQKVVQFEDKMKDKVDDFDYYLSRNRYIKLMYARTQCEMGDPEYVPESKGGYSRKDWARITTLLNDIEKAIDRDGHENMDEVNIKAYQDLAALACCSLVQYVPKRPSEWERDLTKAKLLETSGKPLSDQDKMLLIALKSDQRKAPLPYLFEKPKLRNFPPQKLKDEFGDIPVWAKRKTGVK